MAIMIIMIVNHGQDEVQIVIPRNQDKSKINRQAKTSILTKLMHCKGSRIKHGKYRRAMQSISKTMNNKTRQRQDSTRTK